MGGDKKLIMLILVFFYLMFLSFFVLVEDIYEKILVVMVTLAGIELIIECLIYSLYH